MENKLTKQAAQLYIIRIADHLDPDWSEWLDGMTISYDAETAETTLTGVVSDQAQLYGLLNKLRDLNLTLVALMHPQ
jgi:hypothetical protein